MYNSFQDFVLTYDPKSDTSQEMQILIKGQILTFEVIDLDVLQNDSYLNLKCDHDCYFIDFNDNIPFFLFKNQIHSVGMKAKKSYYILIQKGSEIVHAYSESKQFDPKVNDYDKAHNTKIDIVDYQSNKIPIYYNIVGESSNSNKLILLFNGLATRIGEENNFIPYTSEGNLDRGTTLISFSDRYLVNGSGFLVDDFGNSMYEQLLFKVQELISIYSNDEYTQIYVSGYDSANYIALLIGSDIGSDYVNIIGDNINPTVAKNTDLMDYNTNATRYYLDDFKFKDDFSFDNVLQVTKDEEGSSAYTKIVVDTQSMIEENIDYIYGERSYLMISDFEKESTTNSIVMSYEPRLLNGVDFEHARFFLRIDYLTKVIYRFVYAKVIRNEKQILIEFDKPELDLSYATSVAFIIKDMRYNLLSLINSRETFDKLQIINPKVQIVDNYVECRLIVKNARISNLPKMKIHVNKFIHNPQITQQDNNIIVELRIKRSDFKNEKYKYMLVAGQYLYNLGELDFTHS